MGDRGGGHHSEVIRRISKKIQRKQKIAKIFFDFFKNSFFLKIN
jgi:hypothetical protein